MSSVTYPENWKGVTIENISSFVGRGIGPNYSDIETDVIAINQKCIRNGKVNIDFGRYHDIASLIRQSAILNTNDICINSTGDGTIGRVGLWDKPNSTSSFFVDSHVTIVRPISEESDSKYLSDLLSSEWIQNDIARYCFTGSTNQVELSRTELLQLTLYFPELKQQQKIAEILSTVDNLIDQTQKLIDKYTAVKQGMMADLFSRGIDLSGTPETNKSYGQLRPSYVDAPELYQETELGWIPKGWEIQRIEDILDRVIDYRGKTPNKTEDGIPLITAKNVRFGYIDPEPREYIAAEDYDVWMTRGIPNQGDVLFTTEAPLANVAQLDTQSKVAFAQRMIILQSSLKCDSSFLKYLLMSDNFRRAIFSRGSGSTVEGVKQSEFKKVKVCLPKHNCEQLKIVEVIDSLSEKIVNEEVIIEKYTNIKKGLMQDLLTGKVKV
jgi:type I restriction enzyme S subunit